MAALREDASHRIKVDPKTIPQPEISVKNGIGVIDASKMTPNEVIKKLEEIASKQNSSQP
jgi:hypothetical protein